MAKVMISMPDDLLGQVDAEAKRRRTSRSGLLQAAARREVGSLGRDRAEILSEIDQLSKAWSGDVDAVALLKADRSRGS